MVSEEPFNKTADEYFKEAGKAYELEQFDRDSIAEIKRLINAKEYKDAKQLRDHMEYVEDLIGRLTRILEDEAKEDIANLSLRHDLMKIKDLYSEMSAILDRLEGV
jgi:hypothetical protein